MTLGPETGRGWPTTAKSCGTQPGMRAGNLGAFGPKCRAVEPDHVSVQAADVDGVATDLAAIVAAQIGDRLLQQRLSSLVVSGCGPLPAPFAFPAPMTVR